MTRLHDPDAPDPPVGEFGTSELGAMLRESRVSLGRKLEDVAAELRIRLVYLQAIEDGRLDELPGVAYATGFLRAYGDLLGLDGHDLVRRFKAAGMATNQTTDLHLPSPVEEGRLPTGSVLLVAALLAFGAYGGWYYMSSQGRDPIENVSALPDRLAELVGIDGGGRRDADAPGTVSTEPDAAAEAPAEASTSNSEQLAMVAATGDSSPPPPAAPVTTTDDAAPTPKPAVTAQSGTPTEPVTDLSATPPAEQRDGQATPAAPMAAAQRTAETAVDPTDSTAPRAVAAAAQAPPAAPVENVASAAPPEPPAAPRRKPVTERREPARQPAISVAPVAPEAAPDPASNPGPNPAPAATSIVAAATRGEPGGESGAGGDAPNAASTTSPPVTHRVVLRATTATWVEVGAAEKAPLLSRLMRQGETFVVPAQPGLMMATGNAGGIEIVVDGRTLPRLGTVGEIRRNVALDAESLLATSDATP